MLLLLLLLIIIIIIIHRYTGSSENNIINIIEKKLAKYEARFGERVYNYLSLFEDGRSIKDIIIKLVKKNKIKSWVAFKKEFNICNKSLLPAYESELLNQGSAIKTVMKNFSPI